MHKHHRRGLLFFILLASLASAARAQTGVDLLLKPFDEGKLVEGSADAYVFSNDKSSNGGHLDLTQYELQGRARIPFNHDADPRIGIDLNYMNIGDSAPGLPQSLVDDSFGFGMGIGNFNGWLAGITLGVGYAGNGYIPSSRGYYGMADILVGRQLNDTDSIGFVLDYDGHRSFAPDIPIPGFLYSKQLDPKIEADIGFPFTSFIWKPTKDFKLDATYIFPDSANLTLDYALPLDLGAFLIYDAQQAAYQLSSLPADRRLLFQQQRIQAGLRWTPRPWIDFTLAGGYGFDQRFDSGFDTRRERSVARIGDRPFLHVGVEAKY